MSIQPIQGGPRAEPISAAAPKGSGIGSTGDAKSFGPDYKLDESLRSPELELGVPFAPRSAAGTLSVLPPINPVGAASLTKLSLQTMMAPPSRKA